MEVAPRIHRIEAPFGDRIVCMFLFDGDECSLLVDTGVDSTPQESIAPYLESHNLSPTKIRYVLTSHSDFDHNAGNASLRELAPQALFLCHELDRVMIEDMEAMINQRYGEFSADHGIEDSDEAKNYIRDNSRTVPIDLTLAGGERIRLGKDWFVEVLHTPGHSRGHVSVYDETSRTAVIADATLYNAVLNADGSPAFPPTYRFVDSYLASMQRFMGMQIDVLLTSHYPVYTGAGIDEFLTESRAFVDRMDQVILDELSGADKPRTAKELIDTLAPKMGDWPAEANPFFIFPLYGHLERMVQYGKLSTGRRDGVMTFELSA